MKFFDVIPSELFSPLASPNRALYADALDVLYNAYRENLKIPEDMLYSMLRSKLEQQLADATFEDEDIDVDELRDVSGRARFLIRKLCSKGWFEKERGDDFEEYITVPSYSSRILELFHQLRDDSPIRGYSCVFGTYSALGERKERIRQLDYEVLPNHYQQLTNIEDRLQDEFSAEYQENIGIPRYQQELSRLSRADVVNKNFSNRLEQSVNERDTARRKLFTTRREYAERFKPCPFRVESMDNDEFESEQRILEESELPKYREKIKAARESAMEQFQNDFLAKLKSSIDQVQDQVKSLNRALRQAQFGTDSYQFRVERNPDYAEYYDMIMAPELMEGDVGLLAMPFQNKYGQLIEKLFSQITMADDTQLNIRKQSELQENIQRYTDFRTYLKFDLETTDQNGTKQLLSQTLNTKSGGETQTPFYIAVLASFAQLYRVNEDCVKIELNQKALENRDFVM